MTQDDPAALDPQLSYIGDEWEVLRCCLSRTLLSHTGQSTQDGGAILRPDLAARMPDVSADGLTWTFSLKHGIHYAPPFQTTEVTSPDFVRAFNREAKIGKNAYGYYFDVIRGFDD
jgi:peptide/nickel transport system substrate-binding protein